MRKLSVPDTFSGFRAPSRRSNAARAASVALLFCAASFIYCFAPLRETHGQTSPAPSAAANAKPANAPPPNAAAQPRQPSPVMRAASVAPQPASGGKESSFSWSYAIFGALFASAVGLSFAFYRRSKKRRDSDAASAPFVSERFIPNGARQKNGKNGAGATQIFNADRANISSNANAASSVQKNQNAQPQKSQGNGQPSQSRASENQTEARGGQKQKSFGAFRVNQEVSRLVEGGQGRTEVLTSRAPEDRRAIEAALMKFLNAADARAEARERARKALEEYGYVARRCADALSSNDAFERAAAVRSLGEIRSEMALPFLLEALHDAEAAVRVEAVASLGALAQPSAIGALLDFSRRHPEVPAGLMQSALEACATASPTAFKRAEAERRAAAHAAPREAASPEAVRPMPHEINELQTPAPLEPLPEWLEDESFFEALENFDNPDVEKRIASAAKLAQFQVERSVEALSVMALRDPEPRVRSAAVTSLGAINHESVFTTTLLALADEMREVRAAAARAISRFNFNRADAYARIIQTFDDIALREVAHACSKVGLTSQAVERITGQDPRQAYEAFALLTLMVKAGDLTPLMQAIENHRDNNVRLALVRIIALMGDKDALERLRAVAERAETPEKVREAAANALQKRGDAATVADAKTPAADGNVREKHEEFAEDECGEQFIAFTEAV